MLPFLTTSGSSSDRISRSAIQSTTRIRVTLSTTQNESLYLPLNPKSKDIRLIHLKPGTRDTLIQCTITIARLGDEPCPKYAALSYEWCPLDSPRYDIEIEKADPEILQIYPKAPKIYAILHQASDIRDGDFVIDYAKSALEVKFDVAVFLCSKVKTQSRSQRAESYTAIDNLGQTLPTEIDATFNVVGACKYHFLDRPLIYGIEAETLTFEELMRNPRKYKYFLK